MAALFFKEPVLEGSSWASASSSLYSSLCWKMEAHYTLGKVISPTVFHISECHQKTDWVVYTTEIYFLGVLEGWRQIYSRITSCWASLYHRERTNALIFLLIMIIYIYIYNFIVIKSLSNWFHYCLPNLTKNFFTNTCVFSCKSCQNAHEICLLFTQFWGVGKDLLRIPKYKQCKN